ncbi:MAG: flagellar filament capping protein FliD [Desulfobacula sp.]|uniref:flagellar filament capping protein FliD n=1 Tax=Desulfobacula sp. TaxID=2593537 RepID=UPI0025BFAD0A|nr:flagellar filament capping protein FliD [Desulfobacula sp.]MCD4720746.1 flagellar filament capping protein FliD [Desulfobacula sp.]
MATGTITSLGIGSSLDLQGIIDSLRKADETSITLKKQDKTNLEATKNEFNTINAKLLTMKSNALSLSLSSNFLDRSILVSSSTVLSASVADGTNAGAYSATVNRLTTSSSFKSGGKAATTNSVYVPTIQKSAIGFADTNTAIVLAEDEEMTMTYGYGSNRQTISITGGVGGSTLDDIVTLIANDSENVNGGSTYLTATTYQDSETSLYHLQIAPTSGGTGEDNRVTVTYPPAATGFTADAATFSYTMGDSDVISLFITADTSLADLVTQINDDENNPGVTASIINTGSGDTPYQLMLTADAAGESSRIVITNQLTDLAITEVNGSGYIMEGDTALSFTDPIIIRQIDANTDIIFQEDNGNGYTSDITATIEDGVYQNGDDLSAAVEKALETASAANGNSKDYAVTFNSNTSKLEIKEAGTLENIKFKWDQAGASARDILGFTNNTESIITPSGSSLNASITVDGVEYQRTKNTGLTDVISGATISLIGTGSTSINVTQDTSAIKSYITTLITTFNDIITEIDANDDFDEETETWGSLAKTPSIRSAKDIILNLLGTKITANENITTYFDLGFEINKDGSVSLDEAVLNNKITSNFDDIKTFFIGTTTGTGITGMGDLLNDQIREQTKSGGLVDSETDAIDDRIERLEEQIETETERLDKRYETMAQQFVQLDSYMRKMESQQNYVNQIFSAIEKKE